MCSVILLGNPGAGKSTILNSVVGNAIFPAGASIGTGLTQRVKSYSKDGMTYLDTPGLDDVLTREQAAEQISEALSGKGRVKIIFVCTLSSGSVKSGDLFTIQRVVSAVEHALRAKISRQFSIIVNKCVEAELNNPRIREEVKRVLGLQLEPVFCFMPLIESASGTDNAILENRKEYIDFIRSRAPEIDLQHRNVCVQATTFEYGLVRSRFGHLVRYWRKYWKACFGCGVGVVVFAITYLVGRGGSDRSVRDWRRSLTM